MLIPSTIRVLAFDSGGTLLHPQPPAAVTYEQVGRRYGSRRTAQEIEPRFRAAFARQEQADFDLGLRTDEARERQRWQCIVAEVLDDVSDGSACFEELYAFYAQPDAWRCEADVADALTLLAKNYALCLASNYDHRVHPIVDGHPELAPIRHRIVSAEVGWRKPAAGFFAAICRVTGCSPGEVLFVGDDIVNDYEGARAAGMQALSFDPRGKHGSLPRIACISDLV